MADVEVQDKDLNEKLSPDDSSGTHGKLITALRQMIQESERFIQQRQKTWDLIDEHLRIYLNLSRPARAGNWNDIPGKAANPWARSVLIPLTYSSVMARMVLMYQFFMRSDPFIHLSGVEGGDLRGARMHEAAIAYDERMSNNPLQVWQMLYDAERYGLTCWHDTWEEKYGWQLRPAQVPENMASMLPPEAQHMAQPTESWELLKEWNNWRSIDPRCLLPDPTVSTTCIQSGTRFGHWEYMNWLDLHAAKLVDQNGPFFNVTRARLLGAVDGKVREQGAREVSGAYLDASGEPFDKYPNLKISNVYWKLIPKEWGLSPKEYPEIWHFGVAEKQLIIRAHPLPYAHQQFPYATGTPDYDQHSAFSPGMGEQLIGMQEVSNWLINAHIVNTRKILHDRVLVNDELVRVDDFMNPSPGQQIRLTKEGKRLHKRGMSIQSMYDQFRVSDITKGHLETSQLLLGWAQRMAATSDPIQSMPLETKRTLGEIQEVKAAGTQRIDTPAALLDQQVVRPVAERCVMNRQQFMSIEQMFRINGALAEELGAETMFIRPQDLYGQYDYVTRTPSAAQDPARASAMWGNLLMMLGSNPDLLAPNPETGKALNPHKIFDEYVKSNGVNYLEEFYYMMQPMNPMEAAVAAGAGGPVGVVGDEELANARDAGTVVPIGGIGR